jgi:hypothetical protein
MRLFFGRRAAAQHTTKGEAHLRLWDPSVVCAECSADLSLLRYLHLAERHATGAPDRHQLQHDLLNGLMTGTAPPGTCHCRAIKLATQVCTAHAAAPRQLHCITTGRVRPGSTPYTRMSTVVARFRKNQRVNRRRIISCAAESVLDPAITRSAGQGSQQPTEPETVVNPCRTAVYGYHTAAISHFSSSALLAK